ncbi:SAM-dependent methyltransferase [Kitasatospora sp. LaBMicrA B282]|uniref:SAM-dependent methyltransferase n=1 Tax=Kitasatospora sp. LaBMicrA B282 TaxID=3420949 RepID=UPI003D12F01A
MTDHQHWMGWGDEAPPPPADLHPEIPHPARMYDYYLGGKDNFPADRAAAEKVLALGPLVRISARANRAFLRRAVRELALLGVRRFIDVGTGIPTDGNTHEIAQQVDPLAQVAYLDNDPIVLTHGRALLAGPARRTTAVRHADLRDPAAILADPVIARLLEPGEPVALLLLAVLHFLDDADAPHAVVRRLVEALPAGSFLALSHATGDFAPEPARGRGSAIYRSTAAPLTLRERDRVARFFDGLELLPPGLVTVAQWRPDQPPADTDARTAFWAGVARKPG